MHLAIEAQGNQKRISHIQGNERRYKQILQISDTTQVMFKFAFSNRIAIS